MPRAVVCVPTYQERENMEAMVLALGSVVDTARDRVLVIDDASPDGTGEIALRLAARLPWLSVLQRPRKEGLGPAYLAGFGHALELGAELVVSMDCDFQHDPRDVPRLVEAAADADLVVGSRYVPGGCTAQRGLARRALSRGGSLYSRALLGAPVHDLTAGFKCLTRRAVEAVCSRGTLSQGYAFQIEVTYRVLRAGLRVREIPIRFVDRRAGCSKMTTAIVAEAAWKVPMLRARALAGRL